MATAIEFDHVGKQYRLGLVSTQTLSHDLDRWWKVNVLHKEDPYLKIGETNDRSVKGSSDYVWALRDIDFKVEQGDVVGIIGRNGAGKSTLLKLLSKVTGPTTGCIRARGHIGSLLEVGTGFHPEMTGRENIYMNGAILGMTRSEITRKLDEIVDFSGCERYLDTPVKRYSSGMMVRLGFAVAAHLDPEILVVDEVLAVGDAEFQKKAIGKMKDVSQGEGRTVLFVSHNMAAVRSLCNHGVVLENGLLAKTGYIDECVDYYMNREVYEANAHSIVAECLRVGNDINRHSYEYLECTLFNDPKHMSSEEPLKMKLKVKHNDFSINEFQVGVFITNTQGFRAASAYSYPLKAPKDVSIFEVLVIVPHHNLAKGNYTVDLKLSLNNYVNPGTEYDQIANVFSFEVSYLDKDHKIPFAFWPSSYGSSCMTDLVVNII